jgi:ribosomal protein S18 acetylase RimI-like enzyme
MTKTDVSVRKATADDAPGVAAVLEVVAFERVHSAIDRAWSMEEEREYIESLYPRDAIHVAVDRTGTVVGIQVLDRWSALLPAMSHVAQVGTYLLPEWRRQGVGHKLWAHTVAYARNAGYRKLVIQVRGSNRAAQSFYAGLGFTTCGRLARQITIDGVDDDEVLMELFL